jgi:hypothetical protein
MISSPYDHRRIAAECHSLVETGHFRAWTPRRGGETLAYLVKTLALFGNGGAVVVTTSVVLRPLKPTLQIGEVHPPSDGRRRRITGSPLITTSLALQLHLYETRAHRGS